MDRVFANQEDSGGIRDEPAEPSGFVKNGADCPVRKAYRLDIAGVCQNPVVPEFFC